MGERQQGEGRSCRRSRLLAGLSSGCTTSQLCQRAGCSCTAQISAGAARSGCRTSSGPWSGVDVRASRSGQHQHATAVPPAPSIAAAAAPTAAPPDKGRSNVTGHTY